LKQWTLIRSNKGQTADCLQFMNNAAVLLLGPLQCMYVCTNAIQFTIWIICQFILAELISINSFEKTTARFRFVCLIRLCPVFWLGQLVMFDTTDDISWRWSWLYM